MEEYDIVGGLLRSPLPLVKSVTNHLAVPAEAEFALEGFVTPGKRVEEGPSASSPGMRPARPVPIFKVSALTCRYHPVFQDIVSGLTEHLLLPLPAMEYRLLSVARAAVPATTAIKV